jgi:membrane protease YdiL (CAAX protease family)
MWAKHKQDWSTVGFSRHNVGCALVWGLGAGLLLFVIQWYIAEQRGIPPFFWIQLTIGLFLWILILSPFQEFLFRGWRQPRFQTALGKWPGLIITSVTFALWHLLPPFEEAKIVPIMTISSILYMIFMGSVFGYIFQRTNNIIAPWLAHAIAGLALLFTAGMTFFQYVD